MQRNRTSPYDSKYRRGLALLPTPKYDTKLLGIYLKWSKNAERSSYFDNETVSNKRNTAFFYERDGKEEFFSVEPRIMKKAIDYGRRFRLSTLLSKVKKVMRILDAMQNRMNNRQFIRNRAILNKLKEDLERFMYTKNKYIQVKIIGINVQQIIDYSQYAEKMFKKEIILPTQKIIRSVMYNLKKNVLKNEGELCAICYDPMKKTQAIKGCFQCKHQFHKKCLDKWLQIKNQCPSCRRTCVP